nr:hypothetical protein [Candidatus Gracilibacteria bacterium]
MKYTELIDFLKEKGIDFKYIIEYLGHQENSSRNNWSKREREGRDIPAYVEIALDLYLKFEEEKAKNNKLEEDINFINQKTLNSELLSKKAIEIASKKCSENDITLKEYLSSLIVSKL